MKAIVLGCGRTGAFLASRLEKEGMQVMVIDRNADSFSALQDFGGNVKLGDGVDIEVLKSAGIKDADVFAAVTDKDNTNLTAAQIAKGIFGVKRVACRLYDPGRASIYSDLGLDTICITSIGVNALSNILLESRTVNKFQLGDGSGIALQIKLGPEMDGRVVGQLESGGLLRISAVIRGLIVMIPDRDFVLKADDHIFGVALTENLPDLERALGVTKEENKEEQTDTPPEKGEV